MNLRLILLLALLAVFAAGSGWLLRQTALQSVQAERVKTHVPDYYFTDATVTSMDVKGRPESELSAPRMVHHPDDDSIEIFTPRMRYFPLNGPPWYAQSDHADSPSGNKLVYLEGHVEITRPSQSGGPPLVIDTDRMTVNLDTNVASTDDPVQMNQGTNHMTGIGMDAYLNDNRLIIRSNLHSHYVPAKKNQ